MLALTLFAALLFGLCIGSFLNVCILRLPKDESVVFPASRCPRCGKPIRWHDNIPVLSYLLLRGRCRDCGARISARYPLIELGVAALTVAAVWRWRGMGAWGAVAAVAADVLFAIAVTDWETFLIPDPFSLGLLALGLIFAVGNPMLGGARWARLETGLLGALAGFLMTYVTAVIGEKVFKQEALGGGDVKLLTAIGALTGWMGAFATLMISSFFGAAYGLWLMARKKLERRDPIPFGPFLSLAALLLLLRLLPPTFPFSLLAR